MTNDPGLCQLTEIALKGFLTQKQKDTADSVNTEKLDQDIEAGKDAANKVCQYVDWLLLTVNPNPPHEDMWMRTALHPCQKCHEDILDFELDNDYADLLNMVQRHTNCSTNYCLCFSQSQLKCRFNFPFEHSANTRLEFEEVHSKGDKVQYRAKVVTKRNDPRLNNNRQLQLQGWRANCDIQVVIDHYACVEYLTKYAAKGEPRSPFLKKAFSSIVSNLHENVDSHKVIKKVVKKTVGERDYAAQETMHHLLSLKLHSSSFNVIPVSLKGLRKVSNIPSIENDGIFTINSLLDHYANRDQYDTSPEVMNLNFIQFATKFKVVSGKLTKLPENVIPKVFPTYSSNPRGENFASYCKYQLLRYKPWLRTQSNAWGDAEATNEVLINCWQGFLETSYAQNHVPQWLEKLEAVVLSQ